LFVDIPANGEPLICPSCKSLILPGQATDRIAFANDNPDGLASMNGLYHAPCAKPLLSVKRAYDMLGNWGSGF